jgi:hypothetical protein
MNGNHENDITVRNMSTDDVSNGESGGNEGVAATDGVNVGERDRKRK